MSTGEIELLKQKCDNLEKQIKILEKKKDTAPNKFIPNMDNSLSNLFLFCLNKVSSSETILKIYYKYWSFINYAIICGIGGTAVNYIILSTTINYIPLIIADVIAILFAAYWNYTLTVGSLGYLSGLSAKRTKQGD